MVQAYFDWLAGYYDEATAACAWAAPRALDQDSQSLVDAGDWVLDLGAGTGQSAAPFLQRGCHVVGLDLSLAMMAEARQKHPELWLIRADLDSAWPVRPGAFQLAISAGVYECLLDPEGFIARAWEALAPGGHLLFTFDEYVQDHPVQGERVGRADSGLDNPIAHLAGWKMHRHTLELVSGWLAAVGFELLAERQFEADIHSAYQVPIYYRLILARRPAG